MIEPNPQDDWDEKDPIDYSRLIVAVILILCYILYICWMISINPPCQK
jgi:hypothetical protein